MSGMSRVLMNFVTIFAGMDLVLTFWCLCLHGVEGTKDWAILAMFVSIAWLIARVVG